jgi:hypothetical protein
MRCDESAGCRCCVTGRLAGRAGAVVLGRLVAGRAVSKVGTPRRVGPGDEAARHTRLRMRMARAGGQIEHGLGCRRWPDPPPTPGLSSGFVARIPPLVVERWLPWRSRASQQVLRPRRWSSLWRGGAASISRMAGRWRSTRSGVGDRRHHPCVGCFRSGTLRRARDASAPSPARRALSGGWRALVEEQLLPDRRGHPPTHATSIARQNKPPPTDSRTNGVERGRWSPFGRARLTALSGCSDHGGGCRRPLVGHGRHASRGQSG